MSQCFQYAQNLLYLLCKYLGNYNGTCIYIQACVPPRTYYIKPDVYFVNVILFHRYFFEHSLYISVNRLVYDESEVLLQTLLTHGDHQVAIYIYHL